jgi:hypothetical protein
MQDWYFSEAVPIFSTCFERLSLPANQIDQYSCRPDWLHEIKYSGCGETRWGFARPSSNQEQPVTGPELKQLRQDLADAIGRPLSAADMAKLCGLEPGEGPDTIRRWEVSGPSGPAGKLLRILAMASDRHPILENFNIFDRWDFDEKERPARREAFRAKMRDEIRQRLV